MDQFKSSMHTTQLIHVLVPLIGKPLPWHGETKLKVGSITGFTHVTATIVLITSSQLQCTALRTTSTCLGPLHSFNFNQLTFSIKSQKVQPQTAVNHIYCSQPCQYT